MKKITHFVLFLITHLTSLNDGELLFLIFQKYLRIKLLKYILKKYFIT